MSVLSAEDPTAPPATGGAPSGEHDGLDQLKAANYFLRVALDQIPDGLLILRAEEAEGLGPRILFHNTPFATLVCGDGLRDRFVTQMVPGEAEARELLHVLQHDGYEPAHARLHAWRQTRGMLRPRSNWRTSC